MDKTLAHSGHHSAQRDSGGGLWAALLVVVILALAVWGAWRLGVMAGDKVDLRRGLPDVPSMLRKGPSPQPVPIPTQRRPAVEAPQR